MKQSSLFRRSLTLWGGRNALPRDFQEVISMLEQHRFPLNPTISAVVDLQKAPAILEAWDATPERYTKILIRIPE